MKKIIILDYYNGEAHSFSYSTEKWPEGSNLDLLVEAFGFKLENVEYLVTDKEIIQH